MASGYKDYRRVVSPESMWFGPEQTSVFEHDTELITSGVLGNILRYDMPVGYDLHLLNVVVSCQMPGINRLWIGHGATDTFIIGFDTTFSINFGGDTILLRATHATVYISVFNNDTVNVNFWATMTGFLTLTEV